MASAPIPDVDQGGGLPVSVPDLEAPVMVPADRVDPEMDPAAEGPGAVRDQEGREAEAWAAATMAAVQALTVMAPVDVAERPPSRAQKNRRRTTASGISQLCGLHAPELQSRP
ncbi:hypothetical protein GCM10007866_02280 [Gluconobacter albidus]|nr:hypothetical protein AA3250_2734 [Gluconobacter albidus NBRC 3250]GLQ67780.1 hypothetical protein GCM10007866_02280 [Gluconobacter albidus]